MPTFSFMPAIAAMTSKVTTTATGIFAQLPVAQPQPKLGQMQSHTDTSAPNSCHICTPRGRKCPNNYTSPNHPEWSDSDIAEDWNGDREKEKEKKRKDSKEKEKELKQGPLHHITHLAHNTYPVTRVLLFPRAYIYFGAITIARRGRVPRKVGHRGRKMRRGRKKERRAR